MMPSASRSYFALTRRSSRRPIASRTTHQTAARATHQSHPLTRAPTARPAHPPRPAPPPPPPPGPAPRPRPAPPRAPPRVPPRVPHDSPSKPSRLRRLEMPADPLLAPHEPLPQRALEDLVVAVHGVLRPRAMMQMPGHGGELEVPPAHAGVLQPRSEFAVLAPPTLDGLVVAVHPNDVVPPERHVRAARPRQGVSRAPHDAREERRIDRVRAIPHAG